MAVLSGLVPVFLLVALGALARGLGWAGAEFVRDLNRTIYWFAIPALLIRLLGSSHPGRSLDLRMVTACLVATLLAGAVALSGALVARAPGSRRGALIQAAVRGNLVYMGFPVIFAASGAEGLAVAAVTAAVLIPFQNVLAVVALVGASHRPPGQVVRELLSNPVILGVVAGFLLAISQWHPWPWLDSFLRLLGSIAMPGALIALGAQLELGPLRSNLRPATAAALLKVGMTPAAGLALMTLLHVQGLPRLVGMMLLAAPTAVASASVAQELGGDLDLAGACIMASSLASFPAYVAWSLLLR